MKVVYIIQAEEHMDEIGECEGAFDDQGALLDFWNANDATWRHEYFETFMRKLGIDVRNPSEKLRKKLETKLYKAVKDELA